MIKNILLLFVVSTIVNAAEFIATISDTVLVVGQSASLTLSVKDAKIREKINLNPLKSDFALLGRRDYSGFKSINGNISNEYTAEVTIIPKNPGKIKIPSISVNTTNGVLYSNEIILDIKDNINDLEKNNKITGISANVFLSKDNLYTHQSTLMTLRIVATKDLRNVSFGTFESENCIIEKILEPNQYTKVINGTQANIIDSYYLVTPISKDNKFSISSVFVHGEIAVNNNSSVDPFSIFGINNFTPFSIQTNKIDKTTSQIPDKFIKPISNLEFNYTINSKLENFTKSDIVNAKLDITASSVDSTVLDKIVKIFDSNNSFKVYIEKSKSNMYYSNAKKDIVTEYSYDISFVPLSDGKLSYPDLKYKWFNPDARKVDTYTFEGFNVDIPVAMNIDSINLNNANILANESQDRTIIYFLVGIIFFLLILIIFILFIKPYLIAKKSPKLSKFNQIAFNSITDVNQLRDNILIYAANKWNINGIISLNDLRTELTNQGYTFNENSYIKFISSMNKELYAVSGSYTLDELRDMWDIFLSSVLKVKPKKEVKKIDLNPT